MKRLVVFSGSLLLICMLALFGARMTGRHLVEWPIQVAYRQPLPTEPPFDSVLPTQVDVFKRLTFSVPLGNSGGGDRMLTWGAAQYSRPGDPDNVNIEIRQFKNVQVAQLLINPSDWRLHSRTTNKYYAILQPISFVYTATNNGYRDFTLAYVSGTWNVLIECTNDQTLLAFANRYPF